MKKTMYRIEWRSIVSDSHGAGQPVFETRKDADQVCTEMNRKYPYLVHFPVASVVKKDKEP